MLAALSAALAAGRSPCTMRLGTEPVTNELLGGLFDESIISPTASVVDAGCHMGQWSFHFAQNHTRANVHAIDPSHANIRSIKQRANLCDVHNLRPMRGGLGAAHATLDFASFATGDKVNVQISIAETPPQPRQASAREPTTKPTDPFTVYTLDDLFLTRWKTETLGFAHLDVEGNELDVLKGAMRVIARDRPLLMTEVHVHRNRTLAASVLAFAEGLGYHSWLVDEACGARQDCRNVLHVPHGRARDFASSSTVRLARRKRALRLVDMYSLTEHANPCCAPGGACCPRPHDVAACCSRTAVADYTRRKSSGWWRSLLMPWA